MFSRERKRSGSIIGSETLWLLAGSRNHLSLHVVLGFGSVDERTEDSRPGAALSPATRSGLARVEDDLPDLVEHVVFALLTLLFELLLPLFLVLEQGLEVLGRGD